MTSDDFQEFLTYLPKYPNEMFWYISLFSKIRCSLTYLHILKSDVICECSPGKNTFVQNNQFRASQPPKYSWFTKLFFLRNFVLFLVFSLINILSTSKLRSSCQVTRCTLVGGGDCCSVCLVHEEGRNHLSPGLSEGPAEPGVQGL